MLRRDGKTLSICACNISLGVCNVVSSGALLAIDIAVWMASIDLLFQVMLVVSGEPNLNNGGSNKDSYLTDDLYVNPGDPSVSFGDIMACHTEMCRRSDS